MIKVVISVDVTRPCDEVFDFLSDWTNNPSWQKGMQSCRSTSDPPLHVGSTYDQEALFMGKLITSSFKVVELEPGRKIRIQTTASTMPLDITREVAPQGDNGSRITATVTGGPGGLLRLLDPLMHLMVQRSVRQDYARLKQALDASRTIYHVCARTAWESAVTEGAYRGSAQDRADGFIHFSTGSQVEQSVARHHPGQTGLVLLSASSARLGSDLRWETARKGELFPHLYAELPVDAVRAVEPLPVGEDGAHRFPVLA